MRPDEKTTKRKSVEEEEPEERKVRQMRERRIPRKHHGGDGC